MKKLSLLLLLVFALACAEEDMYITPNGDDIQVAGVVGGSDEVFLVVEQSPTFPGGHASYMKHLKATMKYPESAQKMGVEGNVYLSFIVNETGKLSDFEVVRPLGGGCDEEALRVYMEGPDWIPGMQSGKAVKVRMMSRIVFRMDDESLASVSTNEKQEIKTIAYANDAQIKTY